LKKTKKRELKEAEGVRVTRSRVCQQESQVEASNDNTPVKKQPKKTE